MIKYETVLCKGQVRRLCRAMTRVEHMVEWAFRSRE